jgi:hypothetical protein
LYRVVTSIIEFAGMGMQRRYSNESLAPSATSDAGSSRLPGLGKTKLGRRTFIFLGGLVIAIVFLAYRFLTKFRGLANVRFAPEAAGREHMGRQIAQSA